jgi:LysM repeat protein
MRSRRNLLLILLIVLFIFLALYWYRGRDKETTTPEETEPTGEITETTDEETTDTETETADSPTPTDTPTEETETPRGNAATEFNLGGISFLYSNDLAQNVSGGKSGAISDYGYFPGEGGGALLEAAPDFLDVKLETDNIPGQVGIRTMRDETGTFYPGYEFAQAQLTALESDVRAEAGGDARLQAQFRYVDFANGNGRRSLQFIPAVNPDAQLTNDRLFYIFEGISADGRQYVWFRYPVEASLLSDGPIPEADEADVLAQIDSLAGDNFTPDLAVLDAVVATLNAAPTDTFVGSDNTETAASNDDKEQETTTEETETAATPTTTPPPTGATSTYTVQPGDNLFLIGLAYGLPWTDIAEVNDLADPNDLEIGQTITIPANAPIAIQASTTYLVQPGDTLSQVAEFYGLNWESLAAYNGIGWPYSIQAGQTLYIPSR